MSRYAVIALVLLVAVAPPLAGAWSEVFRFESPSSAWVTLRLRAADHGEVLLAGATSAGRFPVTTGFDTRYMYPDGSLFSARSVVVHGLDSKTYAHSTIAAPVHLEAHAASNGQGGGSYGFQWGIAPGEDNLYSFTVAANRSGNSVIVVQANVPVEVVRAEAGAGAFLLTEDEFRSGVLNAGYSSSRRETMYPYPQVQAAVLASATQAANGPLFASMIADRETSIVSAQREGDPANFGQRCLFVHGGAPGTWTFTAIEHASAARLALYPTDTRSCSNFLVPGNPLGTAGIWVIGAPVRMP